MSKNERPIIYKESPLHDFQAKVRDDGRHWVFGYLAAFNNLDAQGDVIIPGAFKKTIKDNFSGGKNDGVPFQIVHAAWGGDAKELAGRVMEAKEDSHGLFIGIRMGTTDIANRTFTQIEDGDLRFMSVGFSTISSEPGTFNGPQGKEKCCNLTELMLREGTGTNFPANELAEITGFKTQAADMQSRLAKLEETMKGRESESEAADTDKPEEGKAAVRTPDETHLDCSHLDRFLLGSQAVIERSKDDEKAYRKDGGPPG